MTQMLLNHSRRLGEILVERHVLSRDALEAALDEAARSGTALPLLLIEQGSVSGKDLAAAVAGEAGVRFVDLTEAAVDPAAVRALPAEVAKRCLALGVAFDGPRIVVAFADPWDDEARAEVAAAAGVEVEAAVADAAELGRAIDSAYSDDAGPGLLRAALGTDGPRPGAPGVDLNALLVRVVEREGSDLHLTAGAEPMVRIHGAIVPLGGFPMLTGSDIRQMVFAVLNSRQRQRFEEDKELDTSHTIPGTGRFRVNVFLQRDSVGAVMRVIPFEIVPFDRLGLPGAVGAFAELPRGLVLVTGPTGSGKSTTLASLVDVVNRSKPVHIMTVEDPIEFLHHHKTAIVNQREVGEDTLSFSAALKHVLRQDPDVILVGEMRDLETISTALTAAETGHLVFATLHTQDAPQSIDRVIDVFPAYQQQQIRVQLAATLQGVLTQQLVPLAGGGGRVVAAEVLVATPAVRNLVREGKVHQIYSTMQAGAALGMQTMDQALAVLVRAGTVTAETARQRAANPDDLARLAGR